MTERTTRSIVRPHLLAADEIAQRGCALAIVRGAIGQRHNRKAVAPRRGGPDAIAQLLVDRIVGMEGQHRRIEIAQRRPVDVFRRRNDQLIADLAGSRRRAVQDAAARSGLAEDHIGADPCAGILVPDIDELQRNNTRGLAMLRIQGNRAVIVQIGIGDLDPMQLGANDFDHGKAPVVFDGDDKWRSA